MKATKVNKKMNLLAGALLFLFASPAFTITADQIIARLDANQEFGSQKFKTTMKIQKGRRTLVKNMEGYGSANGKKSFIRFTNPEDLNVRYLKLVNELWIYFPAADDVLKISGHMLRQGMMGSDISYEDMIESGELEDKYEATLLGEETVDGQDCYKLQLVAKTKDVTYQKQIVYVHKTYFVAVRVEMFARGGRLLKKMRAKNIQKIGGRYMARTIEFQDMRRRNSLTIIENEEVQFNVNIPDGTFSRRNLGR